MYIVYDCHTDQGLSKFLSDNDDIVDCEWEATFVTEKFLTNPHVFTTLDEAEHAVKLLSQSFQAQNESVNFKIFKIGKTPVYKLHSMVSQVIKPKQNM